MIKKLVAAIKKLSRNIKEARNGAQRSYQEFKVATEKLRERTSERNHNQADIKRKLREIENEDNPERVERLKKDVERLREQNERLTRLIKDTKRQRRRAFSRRRNLLDRVNSLIRYRVINRKKLKKARKEQQQNQSGQPKFEPWMANGYNWQDSNQFVRDWVARVVVLDGNYITSLARDYVPPGGSYTSFHLQGKAGDAGTSAKSQEREYKRGLGNSNYYELFGPNNYQCLKNGQHIVLTEGDPNESLHDTHQHCAGSY